MLVRLRAPMSLVAVFLFIALVAAVMLGGRVVQDWNVFRHSTPAGASAYQLQVAQLEARPLHIPIPSSVDNCVTGPGPTAGGGFGTGPVYAHDGPPGTSHWGEYYYIFAFADSPVEGPVIVRAIHLFNSGPVVFVGPNAGGRVAGTDTLDGKEIQQHVEAVIDTSRTSPDPGPNWAFDHLGVTHPYQWPLISGEASGYAGATGWQIDGPTFTETFLVC